MPQIHITLSPSENIILQRKAAKLSPDHLSPGPNGQPSIGKYLRYCVLDAMLNPPVASYLRFSRRLMGTGDARTRSHGASLWLASSELEFLQGVSSAHAMSIASYIRARGMAGLRGKVDGRVVSRFRYRVAPHQKDESLIIGEAEVDEAVKLAKVMKVARSLGIYDLDEVLVVLRTQKTRGFLWDASSREFVLPEAPAPTLPEEEEETAETSFDPPAKIRSLSTKIIDSTTMDLPAKYAVRLSVVEERRLAKWARDLGLSTLAYCRLCVATSGPMKILRGKGGGSLPDGQYIKVPVGPAEMEEIEKQARDRKLNIQSYMRRRIVGGPNYGKIFDESGEFVLWRLG
jgi:hypothetical protein